MKCSRVSEFLVYDPENPSWEGRDRFFLDPGHRSPMLYSALALQGKFTLEELAQFRQWESPRISLVSISYSQQ